VGFAIELDVAGDEQVGDMRGLRPAQQRPHPRQQLRHREGLHDVVVGAGREPSHPVALLAAGGEHDHRQPLGFPARADAAAQLDAGEARQHPVEHHEIGDLFAQADIGLVAAPDAVHVVASPRGL
jgi:hypothetical protein